MTEKVLLVSYNNFSHIHYFPLGLAYVASVLEQEGHEVEIFPQDEFHYEDSELTKYLNEQDFTVVGIGMCAGSHQYTRLKGLVKAIREAKSHCSVILGGHMVSAGPNYFQRITGASIIVGEAEGIIPKIDNFHESRVYQGFPIPFEEIPLPAWHLFDIDYYSLISIPPSGIADRCFPVLSMRGCPFKCTFCYRMTEGYRLRDVHDVVEEIQILQLGFGITFIDFADELLMTSEERSVEMAQALKPLDIKWKCNGRLNYAKPAVLKEMREAGCVFINYGIESVDDKVLKTMHKALTFDRICQGVQDTLDAGISPGLNMLWGNIGDTRDTLAHAVNFLLSYSDHSQMRTIRPVQPYPGSPLFEEAKKRGLVKDVADFYENKLINGEIPSVNFTDESFESCCGLLYEANKTLIEDYHAAKCRDWVQREYDLYFGKSKSFSGFRPI